MSMINLYEKNIQKQKEVIEELEKLRMADQAVIDSQKQQIHFLEEKISLLEKEKQALTDAGNGLSSTCEKLETICEKQQKLLSSFSGIFSEG